MKNKSKVIVLGAQKGGIGKTSCATTLANHIHYETEFTVMVLDVDFNHSFYKRRQKELALLRTKVDGGELEEQEYQAMDEESYAIISSNPSSVISKFKDDLDGATDYIIIDTPGNVTQKGNILLMELADILIIPFSVKSFAVDSINDFREGLEVAVEKYNWAMDIYFAMNDHNASTSNGKNIEFIKDSYKKIGWNSLNTNIAALDSKIGERITTLGSMSGWHKSIKSYCSEVVDLAEKKVLVY